MDEQENSLILSKTLSRGSCTCTIWDNGSVPPRVRDHFSPLLMDTEALTLSLKEKRVEEQEARPLTYYRAQNSHIVV